MVIGDAGRLVTVGLGIGILLSLGASRAVRSLLFGLQPTDPVTIVGGTVLLAAIGFAAAYLPARHASNVDPVTVLRNE
jgi:ABC-type antimicrobial peptide transport system permease subunit